VSGYLNNFTQETKESVKLAREIAEEKKQESVTTTHLFLGILRHEQNITVEILEAMGFDTKTLYDDLYRFIEDGKNNNPDEILFSPKIREAFQFAETESKSFNSQYIDSIHILLGILKQKDSEIVHTLTQSDITYNEVRKFYIELVNNSGGGRSGIFNIFDAMSNAISQGAFGVFNGAQGTQTTTQPGKTKHPALDKFGRNLTQLAKEGKLDPVIGREDEIKRAWQVLARRKKNNIIFTGASGCGKTAIVEGIAIKIAAGEVPEKMKNKTIYLLDVGGMVAGSKYRGEFEKKLKAVIEECIKDRNIILFVDETHTLIGAGSAEGSMDSANILKPHLSNGEIQLIGATTTEEYQKYFEKDSALVRRFQKLNIEPPDAENTINILKGLKKHYEEYHNVRYPDEIIKLMVELGERYIPTQIEPDRSINTLDEVGSKLSLLDKKAEKSDELTKVQKEVDLMVYEQIKAAEAQDYKTADIIKIKRDMLEKKLKQLIDEHKTQTTQEVTEDIVREVFSLMSGVPVENVANSSGDAKKFLTMYDELRKKIINQDEAIDFISRTIKRKKAGIEDLKKPSVFLFAGPTGCGKTFTSKKLAEFLFEDENKLVFLNGSEYADKTAVNRLTSANPGYVGYGEKTDFEPIRTNPYSILLIDECEKMHPEIWQIFLRIFDEGELKTANGKTINFRNCVIILTSNIGSEISKRTTVGFDFNDAKSNQKDRKLKYEKAIKDYFKPEVYNRISKTIVFNDLNKEDLRNIVELELNPLRKRLKEKSIKLNITEKAKTYLLENSEDKTGALGARPIKRSIENHLNDPIADIILEKGESIKAISVTTNATGLVFRTTKI